MTKCKIGYVFQAVGIKQAAHRIDGIFRALANCPQALTPVDSPAETLREQKTVVGSASCNLGWGQFNCPKQRDNVAWDRRIGIFQGALY